MPPSSEPKPAKSKLWGEIAFWLGLIAGGLGVAVHPDFVADGLQIPEDIVPLASFLVALIGALVKRYGSEAADKLQALTTRSS